MDIYVRNFAFQRVKEVYVIDASAQRKAKQVWVHDGGTWRQVFQTFTPGFSAALYMAHSTEFDPYTWMRVGLKLNTDGSVFGFAEEGSPYGFYTLTSPPTWGQPLVAGIGAGYYCKLVKNSGYDLSDGPALNTWHSLDTAREWAITNSFAGAFYKNFNGTIYLNNQASDTGATSTSFTLVAEAVDDFG